MNLDDQAGAPALRDLDARAACWTRYWQSGALHSCQNTEPGRGNYGGEIAGFWMQVFAGLPDRAQVIEPCCGNVPLGRMLLEQSPKGETVAQVVAVDIAQVAPAWLVAATPSVRARLALHPGTDVGAMPFAADTFDLCMSQFGLEYLPDDALGEIDRVLHTEGVFAAVLHHRDSLTAAIAREEVAHAGWLAGQSKLHQIVADLLLLLRAAPSGAVPRVVLAGAPGEALRSAFNGAMQEVGARIDSSRFPDLLHEQRDLLMQVVQLALQGRLDDATQALQLSQSQLDDALLRQQELLAVAMDEAQVLAWSDRLRPARRSLRPLHFANAAIAGWALHLQR